MRAAEVTSIVVKKMFGHFPRVLLFFETMQQALHCSGKDWARLKGTLTLEKVLHCSDMSSAPSSYPTPPPKKKEKEKKIKAE